MEATFHLTSNFAYLLILLMSTLMLPVTLFRATLVPGLGAYAIDTSLFVMAFISVCLFYTESQRQIHSDWRRRIAVLPLVLSVPGFEGSICVKWLRRLEVSNLPSMARDETSKYTDLLPDGRARQFTLVMDAKSVITHPSGEQSLSQPGFHEIRGLAWSGRGVIDRVEVSIDGGTSWIEAELQEPRLPKAFTRFRIPWRWEGGEHVLMSRAIDETGYVQPTLAALVEARGGASIYHHNAIKAWQVNAAGEVTHVDA